MNGSAEGGRINDDGIRRPAEEEEGDPTLRCSPSPAEATSRWRGRCRRSPTRSAGAGPPVAATTMEDGGEGARATDLEERRAERAREREGEWQVGEWDPRRPRRRGGASLIPSPGRRRRGGSGGDGAPIAAHTGGTGRGRGAGSWAGWLRWAEAHGGARLPAGPVGPVEGGGFSFFFAFFLISSSNLPFPFSH